MSKRMKYLAIAMIASAMAMPAAHAGKNVSGSAKSKATSSSAKNVSGASKSKSTSSAAKSRANSRR
jgi:hypothetical protein